MGLEVGKMAESVPHKVTSKTEEKKANKASEASNMALGCLIWPCRRIVLTLMLPQVQNIWSKYVGVYSYGEATPQDGWFEA